MPVRALSDVLWRERDLLELLVHRLDVERTLLETGRTRRLALAARETETALGRSHTAELGRAAEAQAAAQVLGLPPHASLAELAELAPVPWGEIFLEHRAALRELVDELAALCEPQPGAAATDEVEHAVTSMRESLEEGRASAADDADELARDAGADSRSAAAQVDAELADAVIDLQLQELSRKVSEAREQVVQQGLVDFLR